MKVVKRQWGSRRDSSFHTLDVADLPRGFASYLENVMKRQWGSRRDTRFKVGRHRIVVRHRINNEPSVPTVTVGWFFNANFGQHKILASNAY